jgi:transposase-like protein
MRKLGVEVRKVARLRVWSDADGRCVVDAWRGSGESRAAFCRKHGIGVHRLYFWISKFEDQKPRAGGKSVRFHPVTVIPEEPRAITPIEIRSIRVPRGFAPEELREVLSVLELRG